MSDHFRVLRIKGLAFCKLYKFSRFYLVSVSVSLGEKYQIRSFFRSVYPGMSIRSPCSSRIRGNTGTLHSDTAQKVMFSIKDFFSKCDQIRRKLQMENFIFCAVWHFPCCFYFREEKSTTL